MYSAGIPPIVVASSPAFTPATSRSHVPFSARPFPARVMRAHGL